MSRSSGSRSIDNIVTACANCNSAKSSLSVDGYGISASASS